MMRSQWWRSEYWMGCGSTLLSVHSYARSHTWCHIVISKATSPSIYFSLFLKDVSFSKWDSTSWHFGKYRKKIMIIIFRPPNVIFFAAMEIVFGSVSFCEENQVSSCDFICSFIKVHYCLILYLNIFSSL